MLQLLSDNFSSLTDVFALPNNRLLLAEQIGKIHIYDLNSNSSNLLMDLTDKVVTLDPKYDERGLLGLTLHNDFLYTFYSNKNSSDIVSQWDVKNSKEQILMSIPTTRNYHHGGKLAIGTLAGEKEALYVAVGDGGPQLDDPTFPKDASKHTSQNFSTFQGKIVQIPLPNVLGKESKETLQPMIFAYGLRNPWGISFNGSRCFIANVGFNTIEAIDLLKRNANYGWPYSESVRQTKLYKSGINFEKPIIAYEHTFKPSAVIGGHYINGIGYVFGDYHGKIMIAKEPYWEITSTIDLPENNRLYSIGKLNNDLILLTGDGKPYGKGKVWKFTPK